MTPPVSSAATNDNYLIAGTDSYKVGAEHVCVTYEGKGRLSVASRHGGQTFSAVTDYSRSDRSRARRMHASFVQETASSNADELVDRADRDPDYVTVLSQPLAIELSTADLRTLAQLSKRIPFEFSSQIGRGSISGFLEHVRSRSAGSLVALRFVARGPMRAPVPKRSAITMVGIVTLAGEGYYSLETRRLVAVQTAMAFVGTFKDRGRTTPVYVAYERQIKAMTFTSTYNTPRPECG